MNTYKIKSNTVERFLEGTEDQAKDLCKQMSTMFSEEFSYQVYDEYQDFLNTPHPEYKIIKSPR